MRSFQIIFNPTSAAELAKMPKELQLQILGEFRGLPHQVMSTELEEFGKLERAGRILHRFRIGDYRVYFEKHELGRSGAPHPQPSHPQRFPVPLRPENGRRCRSTAESKILGNDRSG